MRRFNLSFVLMLVGTVLGCSPEASKSPAQIEAEVKAQEEAAKELKAFADRLPYAANEKDAAEKLAKLKHESAEQKKQFSEEARKRFFNNLEGTWVADLTESRAKQILESKDVEKALVEDEKKPHRKEQMVFSVSGEYLESQRFRLSDLPVRLKLEYQGGEGTLSTRYVKCSAKSEAGNSLELILLESNTGVMTGTLHETNGDKKTDWVLDALKGQPDSSQGSKNDMK